MFGTIKSQIESFILNECDHLIIDILKNKLDISVKRDKDDIEFVVKFAGQIVKVDRVNIK